MNVAAGICVETPTPFRNDLMDVARLFEVHAPSMDIVHTVNDGEGQWRDAFDIGGRVFDARQRAEHTSDALSHIRLRKRAAKRALYAALKDITGMRPPWGSLTGIRPTRLYYEYMQEHPGAPRGEAEAYLADVFDVSADNARLLGDIADMQRGLRDAAPDTMDIYIAIPFCASRCAYCAFPGVPLTHRTPVEPYLDALLEELTVGARDAAARGYWARAVYVGGGTPTALDVGQLRRVLEHVRALFGGMAEFTVEAGRPDTIDAPKLRAMKDAGVTRVSVNPQTMNDDTLERIGRAHTAADAEAAFALARAHGFDNINMDIIAALPGETAEHMAVTLERVGALSPDSLTVHALAVKRASALMDSGYAHGDPETARTMARMAADAARGMGLHPYYLYRQKRVAGLLENVGYAREGAACLYNIGMMEETARVLAFGAGAISKWLYDRERRIERAPNPKDLGTYMSGVQRLLEAKRALMDG